MPAEILSELRIVRLRASQRTTFLFFELETSAGRVGTGEATMSGDDAATSAAARRWFHSALTGLAIPDVLAALDRVTASADAHTSLVQATALSALEQCVWDLRGQVLGLPVFELLGGRRRDEITLYANVNRGIVDRDPDGFAAAAVGAVTAGFAAVKCAPFDGVRPSDGLDAPGIRTGLDRLLAVRQAVGSDVRMMVDCHGRLSPDVVKSIVPALLDVGAFWLEEPVMSHPQMGSVIEVADGVPRLDYDTAKFTAPPEVLSEVGIMLAGGEFDFGVDRFATILREGRLRFLMPDVKHCGGVWAAAVIGAMAAGYGARLTPHNPSGPVATVASMHLCAAASNFEILEYQWAEVPSRERMTIPLEPRDGGLLRLSDAPGFGVALDHDAIAPLLIPID